MLFALLVFGPMAWLPPLEGPEPAEPVARAESTSVEPMRVAIAPTVYSSVIPHHTRVAVRAVLGEAVQQIARNTLLLDVDAECRSSECVLRQARDAQAQLLVEMHLTLEQRDYAIEIVVIEARNGRPLARAEGMCRLCAQAELLAEVAAQVMSLQETLEPGAEPAESPTNAEPQQPPPQQQPRARTHNQPGLRSVGWTGVALGLAGVGVGATFLGLDGHEHGPTCGVEIRDINGACPNVYTTNVAGIVSVSLGGVALVTGVGLLIAGGTRRERGAMARVRPTLGGLRVEF